ncbi:MAG: DNA gyrase subunit A [Clostridiales bacterium]|jgi:DNA gyrase subunit A|nr:DNA gyrase subunit A [Clostridiales bacterium]
MDNNEKNGVDKIITVNLEDQMRKSYIDYAMSVIVARALPDVRDGLKPVHRRILHAMNELNLAPNKAYKKSARIVGDTMGKYHPHGDSSIYDAMVRMAQDFSMRYALVDGHGNFGSMDGDDAAAQRYTEARLSPLAMEMIADIEKETVDFQPNYDEEFNEPVVLPSRLPNLLINGSSGIAVGMATNIPPHNLREAADGVIKMIDDRINGEDTDIEDLIDIIKGPDFPTGASILGVAGIKQAYRTGRGKIKARAVTDIETFHSNRERIVVTELPFQVNKARMLEKIGELVSEKRIEGISDIRDESDRNGIRVVIELKKDANANVILNQLYKNSQMQESYGINMLALVENKPRILNLKEILNYYLEHQKEVIARRTRFDLAKARKRAHILEGLLIALDNIDEVINIIRSSKDTSAAKEALSARFSLSEEQSSAIVEMRLRSLTGLEREKLDKEYAELKQLISELTAILNDEKLLYGVIREEISAIKTKFGDERRTRLLVDTGDIEIEDLIEDEISVITFSHLNYVKRIPLNTYRSQNRGGRGVIGMQTRNEDIVKNFFVANTHDYLLYFTNKGRAYATKAYEIPVASRTARGMAIVNMLNLTPKEKITDIIALKELRGDEYLTLVTKKGLVKKTPFSEFMSINKVGKIAIKFKDDDELIAALHTDGKQELFIATKFGQGIRFQENEVRPTGRTSQGVSAIKLHKGDEVVSSDIIEEDKKVLFVSEKGYGKCTDGEAFNARHRGGYGVKIYKLTDKTGNIAGVSKVCGGDELMIITSEGVIIRLRVADISTQGRITQGIKLINLDPGSVVMSIAKIDEGRLE